jgi:hypothetical protein
MLSNPELVHASMQALVDGGFLRDPGEPVGLIDPELISGITAFLFEAGILRDANGDVHQEMPEVSGWYTNEYLAD